MRIPGLKRVKQSARWFRSRLVKGVLILGYHRVNAPTYDPYSLCVSPHHFAEQLEAVRQLAQPLSLDTLVQGLSEGKLPDKAVVLTFDDGYADNLYEAKPLLEYYEIPATIFVVTGSPGREFWWDTMARLVLSAILPEELHLTVAGRSHKWLIGKSSQPGLANSEKHRLLFILYKLLLPLSFAARQKAIDQICHQLEVPDNSHPLARALATEELLELAEDDLIAVGAHTVTHSPLAQLPLAAQQTEIYQSKAHLEAWLKRPVTTFSYPNGLSSTETRALVQQAGFSSACNSDNDITWRLSDPFRLPRFWMPDWNGRQFSQWLSKWL